ncbi:hypothetical protein [Metapseudomonas resinovorans]|uniref:hypothetical protein n=1 Tax=Metapseudomonas resinovorans TaxID=53412 RepID=UPI00131E6308|nr:hypothetical protein [Pseudomonas resinovorans]
MSLPFDANVRIEPGLPASTLYAQVIENPWRPDAGYAKGAPEWIVESRRRVEWRQRNKQTDFE